MWFLNWDTCRYQFRSLEDRENWYNGSQVYVLEDGEERLENNYWAQNVHQELAKQVLNP
jgi:hypothetical protein